MKWHGSCESYPNCNAQYGRRQEYMRPASLILRMQDLPVIPKVIAEILRVVNDSGTSADELGWAVAQSPRVLEKTLKVLNSAVSRFGRSVDDIGDGIEMLGLLKMRDIAASMAASELFKADKGSIVDFDQLWCHSLSTSIWARQVILLKRMTDMDDAVTAALLHDVGILILDKHCRDAYVDVLIDARRKQRHHNGVEQTLLKTTHGLVAAQLCAKWQLPVRVTQLISHHHEVYGPTDPALGVLMLADHLSHEYSYAAFEWGPPPPFPEDILELLDMNGDDLTTLVNLAEMVREQVEETKDIAMGND